MGCSGLNWPGTLLAISVIVEACPCCSCGPAGVPPLLKFGAISAIDIERGDGPGPALKVEPGALGMFF